LIEEYKEIFSLQTPGATYARLLKKVPENAKNVIISLMTSLAGPKPIGGPAW